MFSLNFFAQSIACLHLARPKYSRQEIVFSNTIIRCAFLLIGDTSRLLFGFFEKLLTKLFVIYSLVLETFVKFFVSFLKFRFFHFRSTILFNYL